MRPTNQGHRQRLTGSRSTAHAVLGELSAPSAPRARYQTTHNVVDKLRILAGLIHTDRENPAVDAALGEALGRRADGQWAVPEHDDLGELRSIYRYVRDHVRYTADPYDLETFRRPQRTLELGIGDCDDATALVGAMASAAGYQQGLRIVRTGDHADWNHIYNVVGVPRSEPQRWVPIDATMDRGVGWEVTGPTVRASETYLADGPNVEQIAGVDRAPWLGWGALVAGIALWAGR